MGWRNSHLLTLSVLLLTSCQLQLSNPAALKAPPEVYQISLESAPGGKGVPLKSVSLRDGTTLALHAVVRNKDGTFVRDATHAKWEASRKLGVFTRTEGDSTIFTPNAAAGSLTITASETETVSGKVEGVNITYSVADIANLAFWVKADSLIGNPDGSAVASWIDSSGASRDSIQNNPIQQPKYFQTVLNQKPTLRFDGSNSRLPFPGEVLENTDYTLFVVGARATGSHVNMFIGGTTAASRQNLAFGWRQDSGGFLPNTFNLAHYGNDIYGPDGLFTTKAFDVWTGRFSQTEGKTIFKNGAMFLNSASSTGSLTSCAGTMIGYWPLLSQGFEGDIAEIVVFQRALLPSERLTVETYLKTKYGL